MKNLMLSFLFVCLSAGIASAERYTALNFNQHSLGLEFGATRALINAIPVALEVAVTDTANAPSDIEKSFRAEVEANAMQGLETSSRLYRVGPEVEALLKTGYTFKNLSLIVGIGAAYQSTAFVSVEKGYYKADFALAWYTGITYVKDRFVFNAGFDNKRKFISGVGFIF